MRVDMAYDEPQDVDKSHTATCATCGELKYFVPGVVGPDRWRHVSSEKSACAPTCKHCGKPATLRVGRHDVDGGQRPVFITSHWECNDCARGTFRIEHV